jgi:hypothetical protein
MQHDLHCAHAATALLLDPSSLPGAYAASGSPAVLDDVVRRGHAFLVGARGGHRLRLYVDEPASPELAGRAAAAGGPRVSGLLRVPTGRLHFAATGELTGPGPAVELPAGDYRLEAFGLDWPAEWLDNEVRARVGPGDLRVDGLWGPLVGALVFLTGLVAAAGLILMIEELLRGGVPAFWRALKVWAFAVTTGGLLSGAALRQLTRSGAFTRLSRARDEVERAHPTLVVVLARLDGGVTEEMAGARLDG